MRYRDFGRTGWKVSEIAFGAWQIGGDWGEVDDRQSIDTLLYAYEKGINFVDTAELYGKGHSEEVIGRSLREWKGGKIYVATKAQPVVWPNPDHDNPAMRGRYPDWYLRDNVEKSLRRLGAGTDRSLPACTAGCATASTPSTGWRRSMRCALKARSIGSAYRYGISGPTRASIWLAWAWSTSIQVLFNMFEQRPTDALFPAAPKPRRRLSRACRWTAGCLTGSWTPQTYSQWEPGSVPHTLFRDGRFEETLARVDDLKRDCEPFYANLAEAAMRYVLSAPQLSTLIPGMKNRAEVDMNVAYSDGAAFPAELACAACRDIAGSGTITNERDRDAAGILAAA